MNIRAFTAAILVSLHTLNILLLLENINTGIKVIGEQIKSTGYFLLNNNRKKKKLLGFYLGSGFFGWVLFLYFTSDEIRAMLMNNGG